MITITAATETITTIGTTTFTVLPSRLLSGAPYAGVHRFEKKHRIVTFATSESQDANIGFNFSF